MNGAKSCTDECLFASEIKTRSSHSASRSVFTDPSSLCVSEHELNVYSLKLDCCSSHLVHFSPLNSHWSAGRIINPSCLDDRCLLHNLTGLRAQDFIKCCRVFATHTYTHSLTQQPSDMIGLNPSYCYLIACLFELCLHTSVGGAAGSTDVFSASPWVWWSVSSWAPRGSGPPPTLTERALKPYLPRTRSLAVASVLYKKVRISLIWLSD